MAGPVFRIPYSVFLPGEMVVSQQGIDYQLAHANDFNCIGLNTFTICMMSIVTVALILRLWARKIAKIELKSDDYTLMLGWILSIGAQACSLNVTYNGGFCRHTYPNYLNKAQFEQFGKVRLPTTHHSCLKILIDKITAVQTAYAWNVLYTTSYPVSRISLVLLYRRVFIQPWVKNVCRVLVFCYVGYAIGSMVADFCAAFPVETVWHPGRKTDRQINGKDLFLANAGFNIATDAILLLLPLVIVWALNKPRLYKVGLSFIFCLGVLTVIASIARLVYYYKFDVNDPMWGLPPSQFWTIAEMNLGLLCPCLVTFGPLIKRWYLVAASHMTPSTRRRVERVTGVSTAYVLQEYINKDDFPAGGSSSTKITDAELPPSLRSEDPSGLEAGNYTANDGVGMAITTDSMSRDKDGMALDQDIALANLDPRTRGTGRGEVEKAQGQGQGHRRMGTSTSAVADEMGGEVPEQGIGVVRDWRLDSE